MILQTVVSSGGFVCDSDRLQDFLYNISYFLRLNGDSAFDVVALLWLLAHFPQTQRQSLSKYAVQGKRKE